MLCWLRRGLRLERDFEHISTSPTVVRERFFLFIKALQPWVDAMIRLLTPTEWLQANNSMQKSKRQKSTIRECYPDHLFVFVDGSVTQVFAPSDSTGKAKLFNQKHGMHCVSWYILVTPNGKILYCSHVYDRSEIVIHGSTPRKRVYAAENERGHTVQNTIKLVSDSTAVNPLSAKT